MKTEIDNWHGYSIIHEEYMRSTAKCNCVRRQEISKKEWETMTSEDTLRFFKARGVEREYTPLGYGVTRHSRRRWGDEMKFIDLWHVVPVGTEYEQVDRL